jgi:hypothetical protein
METLEVNKPDTTDCRIVDVLVDGRDREAKLNNDRQLAWGSVFSNVMIEKDVDHATIPSNTLSKLRDCCRSRQACDEYGSQMEANVKDWQKRSNRH